MCSRLRANHSSPQANASDWKRNDPVVCSCRRARASRDLRAKHSKTGMFFAASKCRRSCRRGPGSIWLRAESIAKFILSSGNRQRYSASRHCMAIPALVCQPRDGQVIDDGGRDRLQEVDLVRPHSQCHDSLLSGSGDSAYSCARTTSPEAVVAILR
jgi:hypothetical protein